MGSMIQVDPVKLLPANVHVPKQSAIIVGKGNVIENDQTADSVRRQSQFIGERKPRRASVSISRSIVRYRRSLGPIPTCMAY